MTDNFVFISDADIAKAEAEIGVPNYGALGSIIDSRTYLRWMPDKKRRETFFERNARVVNYNVGLAVGTQTTNQLQEEADQLFEQLNNLKVWGSGRVAWVAGTKASQLVPEATMNCSASIVDRIEAFPEAFHLLCLGCGYGFRIYPEDLEKIPELVNKGSFVVGWKTYEPIAKGQRLQDTTASLSFCDTGEGEVGLLNILVGDSRESWCSAVSILLQLYTGITKTSFFDLGDNFNFSDVQYVQFNFDNVRSEGERITGFGGIASGPEPLKKLLLEFARIIEEETTNSKLTPINAMDMMCIMGDVVRSGNVRRSSLITLFHHLDEEVKNAKRGLWTDPKMAHKRYRSMSNNSILYDDNYKPSLEEFKELMQLIRFEGEPGFIRADKHKQKRHEAALTWRKGEDPSWYTEQAGITNPCLTGDMKLLTNLGYLTLEELSQKNDFLIVSSTGISKGTKVWYTGEKEVLEIKLTNRKILKSTPDHVWMTPDGEVKTRDLEGKQLVPYLQAPSLDGNITLWGLVQVPTRLLPDAYTGKNSFKNLWDSSLKAAFLKGLYSANGSILSKNGRVTLKTISLEFATEVRDSLWNDFQIESYITTNKAALVKFENGNSPCQTSYDLNIGKYEGKLNFFNKIGFIQKYKTEKLAKYLLKNAPRVTSLKSVGIQPVYDFSEPLTNWGSIEGFLCHNCGEINLSGGYKNLKAGSYCNLVSIPVPDYISDSGEVLWEELEKALRVVTRFAVRQTLIDISLPLWDQTQKKERLLGVDLCGTWEAFDKMGVSVTSDESNQLRAFCKQVANDEATKYSQELGIERPLLVTTGKPNGTYAQLRTIASGCHPPYAPFYIRRIRIAATDALAKTLIEQNIPYYPETSEWESYFRTNLSHLIEKDSEGNEITTVWDMLEIYDDFAKPLVPEIKTLVFEFPVKTAAKRRTSDISAIEQLENYKMQMIHYIDHNQSVTVTVGDDEWDKVAEWFDANWDYVIGVSLLPKFADNVYPLLPYQECTEEEFNARVEAFPEYPLNVNMDLLNKFELEIEATQDVDDVDISMMGECSGGGSCPVR